MLQSGVGGEKYKLLAYILNFVCKLKYAGNQKEKQ